MNVLGLQQVFVLTQCAKLFKKVFSAFFHSIRFLCSDYCWNTTHVFVELLHLPRLPIADICTLEGERKTCLIVLGLYVVVFLNSQKMLIAKENPTETQATPTNAFIENTF